MTGIIRRHARKIKTFVIKMDVDALTSSQLICITVYFTFKWLVVMLKLKLNPADLNGIYFQIHLLLLYFEKVISMASQFRGVILNNCPFMFVAK